MVTCPRLEDLIPDGNLRDDEAGSGDLRRFLNDVLQPVLDLLCAEATRFGLQVDPKTADARTLDAMSWDLGNSFRAAVDLTTARKRSFVRDLVLLWRSAGTVPNLKGAVRALTGIEVVAVVSPPTLDFWVLGDDALSQEGEPPLPDPTSTDRAIVGPNSTKFEKYSFQVQVDRVLTDAERSAISEIVRILKPAHTHFVGFLEPGFGATPDHWEVGVSEVGVSDDVH